MDSGTVQNEIFLAGAIVLVGTWVEGNTLKPTIVIGTFVAALGTTVIYDINPELGQIFALIMLTGAILRYVGPLLSKGVGKALTNQAPPTEGTQGTQGTGK